jgi:hypothetical protein
MRGTLIVLGLSILGSLSAQGNTNLEQEPHASDSPTTVLSVPAIPDGELTPSYTCGYCHRDIYRTWQESAHARSLENPVFMDTYRQLEAHEGAGLARICLECHAPLVQVSGDTGLERQLTWEGVSCDFCHSMTSVDMSGLVPRVKLNVSAVKYGPIRGASSMGHEVAYSELHDRSLVCAPCHEFANSEGTSIMTTYSEWKESRSARDGVECQNCHMSLTRANVVDPKIKRIDNAEVNIHEVPGGHSLDQLHKALAVGISPSRSGDELLLEIKITNRGAGHAVPTGMPGRRVILDVLLETTKGASFEERRLYEKQFRDADGKKITRDCEYFAAGVELKEDTRIQADEKRIESFRFPVPAAETAYAVVKLHYEHAPKGDDDDRTWLTFLSETRTVRPAMEPAE